MQRNQSQYCAHNQNVELVPVTNDYLLTSQLVPYQIELIPITDDHAPTPEVVIYPSKLALFTDDKTMYSYAYITQFRIYPGPPRLAIIF